MPKTVVDAGQPAAADSSPAATTFEIPKDPAEYANWRQTGALPEKTPAAKPAGDGQKPGEPAAPKKPSRSSAPASEPGNDHQDRRSKAAERLDEILADLKTAGLTPDELKTFRREARQPDAAQPPAPETTSKPAEDPKPVKPVYDAAKYPTLDDWEAAKDKYYEDLNAWSIRQAKREWQAEQQQNAVKTAMDAKVAAARQRYGEAAGDQIKAAASAVFADGEVPVPIKALIDQSPVIADLMYVMGSDATELKALVALSKTDPGAAIRKVVLLEKLVQDELAKPSAAATAAGEEGGHGKTPGRDASGKFTGTGSEPKPKDSEAPPPPHEVSGRGAIPVDEVSAAVQAHGKGNIHAFTSFREAKNREDFERRRGR